MTIGRLQFQNGVIVETKLTEDELKSPTMIAAIMTLIDKAKMSPESAVALVEKIIEDDRNDPVQIERRNMVKKIAENAHKMLCKHVVNLLKDVRDDS